MDNYARDVWLLNEVIISNEIPVISDYKTEEIKKLAVDIRKKMFELRELRRVVFDCLNLIENGS